MHQKTNKGQPVMKNYIQYALCKLEGDKLKEKFPSLRISKMYQG